MKPVARAAQTALFGLGPPLPSEGYDPYEPPSDRLEALVHSRPRQWRDAWARWAARRPHPDEFATWAVLRSLIRDGQCDKPAGQNYTGLMLRALRAVDSPDAADALRADPAALADDVWLPFDPAFDWRYADLDAWLSAMTTLAADGTISRDRLIDETLSALGREADPGVAKRLMTFHDRQLVPTPDELAARRDVYLRWLESDRDAMIGFALGNLVRLDRKRPVDGRLLLDRLSSAVAVPARTHAKRATELVGRVLAREPELRTDGRDLLRVALAHPAVEVQQTAVELCQRHGLDVPPELVASLDPGLRLAFQGEPASEVAAVDVPPPRLDPAVVPRLLSANAITPVGDIEELLALAAVLLERRDDPDDLERFADGLSRLCAEDVPKGRRTALLRRTKPKARRVDAYVEPMIHAWLAPDHGRPGVGWAGPTDALGRRLTALMMRARERRPDTLLSAPTHRGGFLDPAVLLARLDQAPTVEDNDLAQALLRLPRSDVRTASVLRSVTDRWPETEMPASHDSVRVIAAPDSVTAEPRPDGHAVHGMSYEPGAPASPARLLMSWEGDFALAAAAGLTVQRWLSLVWPDRPELYFRFVLGSVWDAHHNVIRSDRLDAALLTMLHPDEPLGPEAVRLLAIGLQAGRDSGLLATDVVIDAIATRRLPAAPLGRDLAASLAWPTAALHRLPRTLGAVATAGALHAHELQLMLESMLGALETRPPQLVGLVDLLRRVAQEANARVTDPAARTCLEAFSPRSKAGSQARAALAVTGTGAARSIEAAAAAEEAERDRALRWAEVS